MNKSSACKYFNESAYSYGATEEFLISSGLQLLSNHLEYTDPGKKNNLLDIACGTGLMLKLFHMAEFTDLYGVDGSIEMLDYCKFDVRNFTPPENLYLHDFENGAFRIEERKFNHVTIHSAINYLPDLDILFKNIDDLLEHEGVLSFNFQTREKDELLEDEFGKYVAFSYYENGYKFYTRESKEIISLLEKHLKIVTEDEYWYGNEDNKIRGNIIIAKKI